jgi:hypothetical protein
MASDLGRSASTRGVGAEQRRSARRGGDSWLVVGNPVSAGASAQAAILVLVDDAAEYVASDDLVTGDRGHRPRYVAVRA